MYLFSALITGDYFPQSNGVSITYIMSWVFGIFGAVAVLMIVYAGIQLILSQGNSEKVATARRSIIFSAVGLIIILFSWAIVGFITQGLG